MLDDACDVLDPEGMDVDDETDESAPKYAENIPGRLQSGSDGSSQKPVHDFHGSKNAGPDTADRQGMPAPQRRILDALARMEALGVDSLDRRNLAIWSDQSPKSSAYGAHVATLEQAGLVTYPAAGRVELTEAGRDMADAGNAPATLGELHREWLRYLDSYPAALLRALLDVAPHPISRPELADRMGYSVKSSAFGGAVSTLQQLGLVEYPYAGHVCVTDLLFPPALT